MLSIKTSVGAVPCACPSLVPNIKAMIVFPIKPILQCYNELLFNGDNP